MQARGPGGAAALDGADGGGEARVRGGGAQHVPVRGVPRAPALLRPQQRRGRRPARHPRRRRRALPAPRREGPRTARPRGSRRRRALHVRVDDAAGLPGRQLPDALLASEATPQLYIQYLPRFTDQGRAVCASSFDRHGVSLLFFL
jgi:hypothetical protein